MNWDILQWREPVWFWFLLQPIVLLAATWGLRKFQKSEYAEAALLPWAQAPRDRLWRSAWWRAIWMTLAWFAFVIALAGPRIPDKVLTIDPQQSAEVMLLIDLSRSMSASDISPSRIDRAKLKLTQLIQVSSNIRFGISVFAGHPHLLCPPTQDKQLLLTYLSSLHTHMLPTEGSQVSEAIHFVTKNLNNTTHPATILLVTDGDYSDIDMNMLPKDTSLYIFGFGSRAGAALPDSNNGWLSYDGQPVISQSNYTVLKSLASKTNGAYIQAADTDSDWQEMYRLLTNAFIHHASSSKGPPLIIWTELYQQFVLIGLFFLFIAYLKLPGSSLITRLSIVNAIIPILIITCLLSPIVYAASQTSYRDGFQAFQRHDYSNAQQLFSAVNGYAARVGEGNAYYQLNKYPQAATQFNQAVLLADSDSQRALALFNLANCYFKLADYTRAAAIYHDVLQYQHDFPAATINLAHAQYFAQKAQVKDSDQPFATRPGRGPKTALAPPNSSLSQGRVSLADSPQAVLPPTPELPNTAHAPNQDLKLASPAASKVESQEDPTWTYDIKQIDPTVLSSLNIQQDNSRFWQRIFEWEENFPVPVQHPVELPGIKPW